MSQKIFTKGYGPIEFVRTWVSSDGGHIGLLAAGGYAHTTGKPVDRKQDLMDLIPAGSQLAEALEWFENKDKPVEKSTRGILLNPDGSYSWDDGEAVENAADIMNALPAGDQQEAVLAWFHKKTTEGKAEVASQAEDTKSKVQKLQAAVKKKTAKKK